ncbi:MAG TPA: NADH-quinone oxidoreductase subunit NuoF [candidate division Zixibacteria bacterium]|nr:NADH-quinone oxidoreductase subunit NuoF [candidate division Zixibacteria bacterium]MDD4917025.1 NADH-quinone oxidoreductase subunit NuoF [candidate division Zixibacteria bacterium]MDM7971433.1 NADH-quinone oxidoreductase subunit NuoF [candidate division Zixibacteria bacterium]HOD66642.1 NADH-quinone oxidoreductase subunit NuoF [candidate division Zixibacteria bacterium]HPI32539.1 NADH-quinone oxidoreductase subunit NuoF [candidate division Zixibacteria bacterium]
MFYSPVITNAAEAADNKKLHLFRYVEDPEQYKLAAYERHGGYRAWRKVLAGMKPDEVIEVVKKSGLRGRGGAGFPTGMKWGFIPKDSPKPRYLCCNADESEPGTCKDRVLMERDPHAIIEGMAIAAYAIGCHIMFIYIRGEFGHPIARMEAAMKEAYAAGHLGRNIHGSGYDLEMVVHTGGGAYICGEETALLNSLEGERGMSRIRPPFPAIEGLYACPTIVNNVESLAAVPHIIANGPEWYRSMGTEKSAGTKIFSLSGHVNRPGNYEVELGFPLKKLIFDPAYGGGLRDGRPLKGVIPGGSSTPFLTPDAVETVNLDYESLQAAGSMLGSGAVIVFNEDTCIVWLILRLIHFYRHESCGKCTPCREGTAWLEQVIRRIEQGQGKPGDLELIEDVCGNILGRTICPLGDAAVMPIQSAVKHWRDEWRYHIDNGRCLVKSEFAFK